MNEDELVDVLEDARLSRYQSEAYVTLLELGAVPATEVANASDVPDPRIYDVLRDLEDEGFVETYEQGCLQARARDPEQVLADLRSQAERYETAADEIEERWNAPEMDQSRVSIVSRFDTVLARTTEYVREAQNQIQLSVTVPQFERLRPALEAAVENDVIVKLTLNTTEPEGPDVDPAGAATETRVQPLIGPFLVIVDRNLSAFVPHGPSTNEYGLLVDDRNHTFVLHTFFLSMLWNGWSVFHSERDSEPPMTYTSLRRCISEIGPLFEDGATLRAVVEGADIETRRSRTHEGTIVKVTTSSDHHEAETAEETGATQEISGVKAITIDTGEERVEVGGWGATIEDVEAERITITDVTFR